tara:strand:- start:180 stop:449 length:270 start_codon:yes stop_codon:yes gene_type:complete
MPKKRRKLNPEMEKDISEAKRRVELVTAMIYDIEEEEIQGEYITAFQPIKNCVDNLYLHYTESGFNEEAQVMLSLYKKMFREFEQEYEI